MPAGCGSPSILTGIIASSGFQAAHLSQKPEKIKKDFRFVIQDTILTIRIKQFFIQSGEIYIQVWQLELVRFGVSNMSVKMIHLQEYQKFQQVLYNCREFLTLNPPDFTELQQSVGQLQQLAAKIHHELQQDPHLDATIAAFQVEINKQLGLLKVDVLFLRTAKQAATIAQRLRQMIQRLDLLDKYCEGIKTRLTAV